jgi:hypothetical protein
MVAVKYGHLEAVKCMLGTGAVKLDVCTKVTLWYSKYSAQCT